MPITKALPGPFKSSHTPWIRSFAKYLLDSDIKEYTAVQGSQTSKTESLINIIGWLSNFTKQPTLFLAPTENNAVVFKQRILEMIQNTSELSILKEKGYYLNINGMPFYIGWLGSMTEVASRSAKYVLIDEIDQGYAIKGHGDTYQLAKARQATFSDSKIIAVSTPTYGRLNESEAGAWGKLEKNEENSKIWSLYEKGSQHIYMLQCPNCTKLFTPKIELLKWDKDASSEDVVRQTCYLECPNCRHHISPKNQLDMISTGRLQATNKTGDHFSMHVSGICSTYISWQDRSVQKYKAKTHREIQVITNTEFGQCYAPPLFVPNIQKLKDKKQLISQLPANCVLVIFTDVHAKSLNSLIVGFTEEKTLILEYILIGGDTSDIKTWDKLSAVYQNTFFGKQISWFGVDAGYNPTGGYGNNIIYRFGQQNKQVVLTKGASHSMVLPYKRAKTKTTSTGRTRYQDNLWLVNRSSFRMDAYSVINGDSIILSDSLIEKTYPELLAEYPRDNEWIEEKENHAFDCMVGCLFLKQFHNKMQVYDTGNNIEIKL